MLWLPPKKLVKISFFVDKVVDIRRRNLTFLFTSLDSPVLTGFNQFTWDVICHLKPTTCHHANMRLHSLTPTQRGVWYCCPSILSILNCCLSTGCFPVLLILGPFSSFHFYKISKKLVTSNSSPFKAIFEAFQSGFREDRSIESNHNDLLPAADN